MKKKSMKPPKRSMFHCLEEDIVWKGEKLWEVCIGVMILYMQGTKNYCFIASNVLVYCSQKFLKLEGKKTVVLKEWND